MPTNLSERAVMQGCALVAVLPSNAVDIIFAPDHPVFVDAPLNMDSKAYAKAFELARLVGRHSKRTPANATMIHNRIKAIRKRLKKKKPATSPSLPTPSAKLAALVKAQLEIQPRRRARNAPSKV